MRDCYLVIDSSSGSVRAYVATAGGEYISKAEENIDNRRDPLYPDALGFEPQALLEKLIRVCRAAAAGAEDARIIAVSATSQREGVVLLDKEGRGVAGFPNIDNRGAEWESAVPDRHGIYSKTGHWVSTLFPAVKFLGLRARQPEIWAKAEKFTSISDWIGYVFTGKLGYEPSQAGETLLFDIEKCKWSDELCAAFDVPRSMLPDIVSCGQLLGGVTEDVAKRIGVAPGTPFIVGGADTQMAVESCQPEIGDIVIVAGTTSPMAALSREYIADGPERCWVDRHVRENTFIIETNVGVSGMNYQRAKDIFCPDMSYEQVEAEMLQRERKGCFASVGSMIFHRGKITPKGAFFVDAPLSDELSRVDFVRAVLLDYAYSFKMNFEELCDITGGLKGTLRGVGGGFSGTVLPMMISELTGMEIAVESGFAHASCKGLVRVLNRYFGVGDSASSVERIIRPRDTGLINGYEEWKTKRELINP